MNNIRAMVMPRDTNETQKEKWDRLESARHALLCTNHLLATATLLYDDVVTNVSQSIEYIRSFLRPH